MTLIAHLLTAHQCIDAKHRILWHKVAEDPTLTQHVLLHVIQCCNDARFLPEEVVTLEKELTPIALSLCAQFVIPLRSIPTTGASTLFLENTASSLHKASDRTLHVAFLPVAGASHDSST